MIYKILFYSNFEKPQTTTTTNNYYYTDFIYIVTIYTIIGYGFIYTLFSMKDAQKHIITFLMQYAGSGDVEGFII